MIAKLRFAAMIAGCVAFTALPSLADDPIHLDVTALGGPSSSINQLAREMEKILVENELISSATITNTTGANSFAIMGTFVTTKKRNPGAVLLHGTSAMYFPLSNNTPVTLDDMRPLARLTGDYGVVVARANSEFGTLDQLLEALKTDPGGIVFGAGAPGQAEHIFFSSVGRLAGVEATRLNFIPYRAGEVTIPLLNGQVDIAGGSYRDYAPQVEAGELKVLAVAAPERKDNLPGVPTFRELGHDLVFSNWRGLEANSAISEEDFQHLQGIIAELVKTPGWVEFLDKNGLEDLYLPSNEFGTFLQEQKTATLEILDVLGLKR